MLTTDKTYLQPKTVSEAIDAAYEYSDDFKYIAGGTDVFVNKFQGNDISTCLIDITDINELNKVIKSDSILRSVH
jgi:CO/xanthine dehydrogenase FAD-binding subunit